MHASGYVPEKRRLDDDVADLQCKKLRGSTTDPAYRSTCENAESHFAADGYRSEQPSNVRDVALENVLATAVELCPFAISD